MTRSLRARLVALAAMTTLIVLAVAAVVATWQIQEVTERALSAAVHTRLATVQDGLSPSGVLGTSSRLRRTATYVQVLDADGRVVAASPALADAAPLLPLDQARRGVGQPELLSLTRQDVDLAVIAAPRVVNGRGGAVIVAVDSQGFLDARDQLQTLILLGVPLVVLLTAALSWLVTGRALRAVTRLAEDADALSVSDSGRGLTVDRDDVELARLVDALNRMLGRLSTHYATNLAAAAETTHRLRTPLATMRAEAELALLDDDATAAKAALERIITDTDRLTNLVNRLLSAASGRNEVRDISMAAETLTADWQRQAAAHEREVVVHCSGAGEVDAILLGTVLDPLVENALRCASGADPIRVDIDAHEDRVTTRVTNTGVGVPPDQRDRLFQPWVGQAEGGLGLWLARESARSAGGDAWCEEPGPPTTTFVAQVPATTVDSLSAAAGHS